MSFDALSRYYDLMEAVLAGPKLDQVRTQWLGELGDSRTILSMGEGHGRFALACRARWPRAEITCVDASAGMLGKARQKIANGAPAGALYPEIHWEVTDAVDWDAPPRRFDALVTCFFLDCFPPSGLEAVIAKLAQSAKPNSVWLVADFALPERGFWRWRARAVHALMYAFFRCAVGLPARRWTSPDRALQQQGFQLERRAEFERGLLRADLWRRGDRSGPTTEG